MAVEYSLYVTEDSLWRTFLLSCVVAEGSMAVEYSPYVTEDPSEVEWLVGQGPLIVPSPDRETSTLLPLLFRELRHSATSRVHSKR